MVHARGGPDGLCVPLKYLYVSPMDTSGIPALTQGWRLPLTLGLILFIPISEECHLNTANSQFFLVIGDARQSLDRRYTTWGWIVDGMENARRINRGEPPQRPTPIVRMRIASDMPESERPSVQVMRTDSKEFIEYIHGMGYVDDTGFVKDLCDIRAPRRIDGKIEL